MSLHLLPHENTVLQLPPVQPHSHIVHEPVPVQDPAEQTRVQALPVTHPVPQLTPSVALVQVQDWLSVVVEVWVQTPAEQV